VPLVVVDASIAVKWFFREVGSKDAVALRESDSDFIAPELIIAEIGNAAWAKQLRKEIAADDAMFAVQRAPALFAQLVPVVELAESAMHLAMTLRQPVYDCLYLALAQRENVALVTDDEDMFAASRKARIKTERL
jgi:predicted nucleic acid-binding protein